MTPPKKNGGYRDGQIDQILKEFTDWQTRIERKLDANLEWQRGVDSRLASGNVMLDQLAKQGDDHAVKIVALEISDRKWGGAAVIVAAAFAAVGSVVGTALGIRR